MLNVLSGTTNRSHTAPGGRGKEPTYERRVDPVFKYPLTIPNHPGDIRPGTARSIIDALMNDVDEWKEWFDRNDAQAEPSYDDDDDDDDDDEDNDRE